MDYKLIHQIVDSFYEVAKKDILIGYHFRVIKDFDEHIPRIADFWNLQLNGEVKDRNHLPFKLLNVHIPLKVNRGELGRWEILFQKTLNEYLEKELINSTESNTWLEKITFFKGKLEEHLFN